MECYKQDKIWCANDKVGAGHILNACSHTVDSIENYRFFRKPLLARTNFISNDNWYYMCRNYKNLIFIETQKLEESLEYLQNINYPFVLVTSNNLEVSSTHKINEIIMKIPNLTHWFATHPSVNHERFTPLPLGVRWNWKSKHFNAIVREDFEKNIKIFDNACAKATNKFGSLTSASTMKNLVYWNLPPHEHYNYIFEKLNQNNLINNNISKKSWEEYLSDLRNSIFCISPPGKGIDSHRIWESLHMGCIPLVQKNGALENLYKELPVIIVEDWSEVTKKFLLKKQKEIAKKNIYPHNLEKLKLNYWKNLIHDKAITYRAVIVEPRKHIALESVLNNICTKLDCPITIVHGTENKDFVNKIALKNSCIDKVLEVNAQQLDAKTYSKLLTTVDFWDKVRNNEKKILIFQTDAGICGDGNDIFKYIMYDYCGAPWPKSAKRFNEEVGNGGFSIRDPEIAKKHILQHGGSTINEDIQFTKWCSKDKNCNLCPLYIGKNFSSEQLNTPSWGFHQNYRFIDKYKSICNYNEAVKDLNHLYKEKDKESLHYKVPTINWKPTLY